MFLKTISPIRCKCEYPCGGMAVHKVTSGVMCECWTTAVLIAVGKGLR